MPGLKIKLFGIVMAEIREELMSFQSPNQQCHCTEGRLGQGHNLKEMRTVNKEKQLDLC